MRILFTIVMMISALWAVADNVEYTVVGTRAVDAFTGEKVPGLTALVVNEQGDTIGDSRRNINLRPGMTIGDMTIVVEMPSDAGRYRFIVKADGYESDSLDFDLKKKNPPFRSLGTIDMMRRMKQSLDNLEVNTSRVKMVMKGDTIVYDALAFQLADGSMLDRLIEMLPGVTLGEDGRIEVNGRFVQELTVNGSSFFKGNPLVALRNLPAYTVRKLKVYDKEVPGTQFLADIMPGKADNLVMDVELKREYHTGWMVNAEVAGGLQERYLGKAFALGYSDNFRLAAFINVNNIKDTQAASQRGEWSGGWGQNGLLDLLAGGVDYQVENKKKRLKADGNIIVTGENVDELSISSATEFYPAGNDVFSRVRNSNSSRRRHLMTNHNLEINKDRWFILFQPNADIYHSDDRRHVLRAAFSEKPAEAFRGAALDSLGVMKQRGLLLNSTLDSMRSDTDWEKAGFLFRYVGQTAETSQLNVDVTADYMHNSYHDNRLYSLFASDQGDSDDSRRNRNSSYNCGYGANVSHTWMKVSSSATHMTMMSFTPALAYHGSWNSRDVTAWSGELLPGEPQLRSTSDIIRFHIDRHNSYDAVRTMHDAAASFDFTVGRRSATGSFSAGASVKGRYNRGVYDYDKVGADTLITRDRVFLEPQIQLQYERNSNGTSIRSELKYSLTANAPNLGYLVNTTDSSDPLNIYAGAKSLADSRTHSLSGRWSKFISGKGLNMSATANWRSITDQVAYAREYDPASGVSLWTPVNVDGNWNASASFSVTKAFGPLELRSETGFNFYHNVDYATLAGNGSGKTSTDNYNPTQSLSLTARFNSSNRVSISTGFSYRGVENRDGAIGCMNLFDVRPGVNMFLTLPVINVQLVSDFSVMIRRGYQAGALNGTECWWNAEISRSLLKGKLLVKLKAVDILGQVSRISTTVNAQGITETWQNTLPRYAMLSLSYRFHIQPAKR